MSRADLSKAIWRGDRPEVTRLVNLGADINGYNARGSTPLVDAVTSFTPSVEMIQHLLDLHAAPDLEDKSTGFTPLMFAAQDNLTGILHLLLSCGANVATQDKQGRTALWLAVAHFNGSLETVRSLIDAGGDPDAGGPLSPRERAKAVPGLRKVYEFLQERCPR